MLIRPNPTPINSPSLRKLPPGDPPGPEISYQDWRALDGPLLNAFTQVTSSVVGAGNGLGTALVGASAGGAHGIVHGAQLDPRWGNFLLAANLAAIGAATANYGAIQPLGAGIKAALGIALSGATSSVRLGISRWGHFPIPVQKEVYATAEKWTDHLLPGNADSHGLGRLARAAAGELAGASGGGLVGFRHGLQQGRQWGHQWVNSIQYNIYQNMHGFPKD